MRLVRSAGWIVPVSLLSVFALTVLFHNTPAVSAQTGPPPSSSISSSSGPVSWDFSAVGGGTVTNVGIQDICPPGMCDDHDLTVVLPAPAATFYQTMTAKLTITYTWTSTVPTDLDVFAISPSGADHGPGSPDDTTTGPGIEILTVTDPVDGKIPALTPEGQQRLRRPQRGVSTNANPVGPFESYLDMGLYDRCITRGIPGSMMPAIYGNSYEIIQSPGWVAIQPRPSPSDLRSLIT